ncbi:hypothetical protein J3F83DRAFT_773541, partial [Trichoderma novae-zelandiae]
SSRGSLLFLWRDAAYIKRATLPPCFSLSSFFPQPSTRPIRPMSAQRALSDVLLPTTFSLYRPQRLLLSDLSDFSSATSATSPQRPQRLLLSDLSDFSSATSATSPQRPQRLLLSDLSDLSDFSSATSATSQRPHSLTTDLSDLSDLSATSQRPHSFTSDLSDSPANLPLIESPSSKNPPPPPRNRPRIRPSPPSPTPYTIHSPVSDPVYDPNPRKPPRR